MNVIAAILESIALVLISLYLSSLILGHWHTWRYFSSYVRNNPPHNHAPAVSIIKPNRGLDPWTAANFRGFCEQQYASPYEIIFCVEDAADPSVPVIRQLMAEYPDRNIRLVFSDALNTSASGKLRNLIAGVNASRYDVLVLSDSDVRVGPEMVAKAVQPMAESEVGLAFAVPVYGEPCDRAAAMLHVNVNGAALGTTSSAFLNRIRAAVGSTMVVRRDVLNAIGGLDSFSSRIVGIDISISRAIFEKGFRIHLLGEPARIIHPHSSFSSYWWQIHRWLVTMRSYYPGLVPAALLFGVPLWWGLVYVVLFAATGGSIWMGVLVPLVVILAHTVSAVITDFTLARDLGLVRYLWVIPIVELLTLPLLIYSALTDRVVWGGRWVRIHRDLTAEYVKTNV